MKKGIYLCATNKRLTITEKDGILEAVTDYYKDGEWSKDTAGDCGEEQGEEA
jgi:hypothetical protein